MPTTPIILCIDFDSFFASCEQHFNPNLRGVPIGVTAANGRTCIIAASREAKKYGVKTGTRTWDAVRMCPSIQFVKSDFERYYEITKKFLSICAEYSPSVELYSIDELFIDLTPVLHLYPSLEWVVTDIKNRIKNEVGEVITVSCGASHNKLLAKLASGLEKPDGFVQITESNLDSIYARIDLTAVSGIGERLKIRLNMMGIFNLFQLRKCPYELLRAEFGPACATHLKAISQGQDVSLVKSYKEMDTIKSVGRNYCLPANEYDQTIVLQIVYELCEEIARKLRRLNKKARTVGLSLAGERTMSGRKTTSQYMNKAGDLYSVCLLLYKSWGWGEGNSHSNSISDKVYEQEARPDPEHREGEWVRQISIWATELSDDDKVSISLFENPRRDDVLKAVDRLNDRYGGHMVRNGFLTYAPKLKTVPNGFLADKWERYKLTQ